MKEVTRVKRVMKKIVLLVLIVCVLGVANLKEVSAISTRNEHTVGFALFSEYFSQAFIRHPHHDLNQFIAIDLNEGDRVYYQLVPVTSEVWEQIYTMIIEWEELDSIPIDQRTAANRDEMRSIESEIGNLFPTYNDDEWRRAVRGNTSLMGTNSWFYGMNVREMIDGQPRVIWKRILPPTEFARTGEAITNAGVHQFTGTASDINQNPGNNTGAGDSNVVVEVPDTFAGLESWTVVAGGSSMALGAMIIGKNLKKKKK